MEKVRRRSKKPGTLNLKRSKKMIMSPMSSEADNPDNYPSLSHYLQKTGKIKLIPKLMMLKAKKLFIHQGLHQDDIAHQLNLDSSVVMQWITMFDWEEKRQVILFRQFQSLEDLKREKSSNIDFRHDRIASSLEATVERMIHQHHDPNDEFELAPKDLTSLATTLKSMQVVRRTVHDKPTSKSETKSELLIDSGPGLDNLVKMVQGLSGAKPMIEPEIMKKVTVSFQEDNDRDYEM